MLCNSRHFLRKTYHGIGRFHSVRVLCKDHLEPGPKGSYKLVSFPEPDPLTPRQAAFVNSIFAKPVRFLKSIQSVDQLTGIGFNEIAFVGRSNVGKSSLINRITNNNKLVKTSSKPGHTRALNLFNVADRLTLVDMPGYGFRSQAEWGDLILTYLGTRKELKRLFIVIDPIAGIKETDKQLMKILDQQPLSYQIVLTKRDRMTDEAFNAAKADIERYLVKHAVCCYPELLSTGMRRKSKSKSNESRYENDITRIRWSILKAAGIKPKGT